MSRKKDSWSWVIIVAALVLIISAAVYALWPQFQPHTTVHIGDAVLAARVAKSTAEREKGLSGTDPLRQDEALLLVFDSDNKWPIWMKDMRYPLDIVWLDKDKKVVYIVKNAPPESYPYEQFTPKENARYVLELSTGTVTKKSIMVGGLANFDENHLEGWGV